MLTPNAYTYIHVVLNTVAVPPPTDVYILKQDSGTGARIGPLISFQPPDDACNECMF